MMVPPGAPAPRVSARIASVVVRRLQALGVGADDVLRSVGLPPGTIAGADSDADARIPLPLEESLWAAAAEAAGDPLFGLHAAESVRAGGFDVLDYVVRTAPTLRASLERLARYNRLLHDAAAFTLVPGPSVLRVEHGLGTPARPASPQAAEFTLASLVVVGRQLLPRLRIAQVQFAHDALGPVAEYQRVFGIAPRFGTSGNALSFPAGLMDLALPAADPVLSRIVTAHAEQALAALPPVDESLAVQVRRLVAARLPAGPPPLEQVARELHLTGRSLQRRLKAQGQGYAGLVDEVRRELALRYVADRRLALGEVAYLLGFSEPSAFHRAFRRWTGATPAAFRPDPMR